MARSFPAVLGGFMAMVVIVFLAAAGMIALVGPDTVFEKGSYTLTAAALVGWFAVSVVSAVAGGIVAAKLSPRGVNASRLLALLILVSGLGLAGLIALAPKTEAGARPADESLADAVQKVERPTRLAFVNPLVSSAGVLLGGMRRKDRA